MIQLLYANVQTLPTSQGEFHHSHISLIMNPTLYTTLSNTVWVDPSNNILYTTVLLNATTAHLKHIKQQHNEGHLIYENSGTMDETLKIESMTPSKTLILRISKTSTPRFWESGAIISSMTPSISTEIHDHEPWSQKSTNEWSNQIHATDLQVLLARRWLRSVWGRRKYAKQISASPPEDTT